MNIIFSGIRRTQFVSELSNSISGFSRAPLEHVELEAINYTTQEHTATASMTQEDAATAQMQPQPQLQTNSNRQKKKTTSAVEDCRMELMKNERKLRLEREGVLFEYEKQIKKAKLERELLLLQTPVHKIRLKTSRLVFSQKKTRRDVLWYMDP